MKLEALSNLTKATSFHWEDGKSFEDIDGLVERVKATNIDKTIMYNEWQRVEQERTSSAKAWSKRKTKVSKKVSVQEKVSILKKKLIKELLVLKDRLIRVHSQYKAFKAGREELNRTEMLSLSKYIGPKTANSHSVVRRKKHITTKTM